MIVGYHLIWTAYGWWLPNDPRGSMSQEIRAEPIAELGELHHGRKEDQPSGGEIRRFYEEARTVLKHELLTFSPTEGALIGATIGDVCRERSYTCYACAIMPDHAHMLIRRHKDHAEEMIAHFQTASRARLLAEGSRPPEHPVWGGPGYKVFLNTKKDLERIAKYIWENPLKAGLPAQRWEFVTEYDGWMPPEHLHTKKLPRRAPYSRRRRG